MSALNHSTGSMSEQMVAAYLTGQGRDVFVPLKTQARCDFIYLLDAKPVRAQVKTATRSTTRSYIYEQCRLLADRRGHGRGHPYTEVDVDEVWVVGTHLWCFPISAVSGRSSLCLVKNNPNPRPNQKDYEPDDYIVVRGSWEHPWRDRLGPTFAHEE